jgi:hypothetical protein
MRCYICDYSPTCESLYHETLELNSFASFRDESELPESPSLAYHSGQVRMTIDDHGRDVCSRCALYGQDNNPTFNLEEAEADLILAANDNEPIDVEFEEVA